MSLLSLQSLAQEQTRQNEEDPHFRSLITEGTFVGIDFGKSMAWNSNQTARLNLDWMPGRVGFHLGVSQFQGNWGSLLTEKCPCSFNDPKDTMNPEAEIFRTHTEDDNFKMNLLELAWTFTSTMIRKSQNYLMQLNLGYIGGQAVDSMNSKNFLVRGFYAEGAAFMVLTNDRKGWLRFGMSYSGAQLIGPPKVALTENERSLYIQIAQIHIGYFYLLNY